MPHKDQKKGEPNLVIRCACGCGNTLLKYDQYGRSRLYLVGHGKRGRALKTFWDKVEKTDNCWLWKGHKTPLGYGQITHEQKPYYAHRLSYEMAKGPIPPNMEVMHICDNPSCVNPKHLSVGTHWDNMHDATTKGRTNGTPLTDSQVRTIKIMKEFGYSQIHIATEFDVNPCTISRIVNGKRRVNVSPL